MPAPRRLLVRGVNWLGDAVMTTPALLRLREALPSAHLALLTPRKLAPLWIHHPALDQVIEFQPEEGPLAVGRRVRADRFDAALILPNSPRSALEAWWARIPRRVGYARRWRRLLLTDPLPARPGAVAMRKPSLRAIRARLVTGRPPPRPAPAAHHTLDYLRLAAALGAAESPLPPLLAVAPGEIAHARRQFGLDEGHSWLALNPGAEYGPAKRWPADRFAAAAKALSTRTGARWVILGGPADVALAAEIAQALPGAVNLASRTSLRELMAVLTLCRAVLTNDTGPMHVAAALGVPVVVPFGSTSPDLTGPGLPGDPRHRLVVSHAPCSPCFLRACPIDFRCMRDIPVDRIVDETLAALDPRASRPSPSP